MFKSVSRVLLSCLTLVLAVPDTSAADYYACDCDVGADPDCVPGDDRDPGTASMPWRSYEQARSNFAGLAEGDAIRFCEGGSFQITVGSRWVNSRCLAGIPCLVGSYTPTWASGDEARPIISESIGSHGFAPENGGNAQHQEGYVIENLDLRGSGAGFGVFLYNDIDDVTLRNLRIEGFGIGVHLAGSNPCSADPLCDGLNERLTLLDSEILNNTAQGFLGASSGTLIENNIFESNGSQAVFDHNIYVSGSNGGLTTGIRILRNSLHGSALDALGSCQGASFVVHGEHADLLIEDNVVWEDVGMAGQGCWGIAVDAAYGSSESFNGVVIRGNLVRNVGNLGIGLSSCVDCVVEDNVVIQENTFGFTGVAAPDRPTQVGDQLQDRITVRNNSIWLSGGGGTGIAVHTEGTGHVVVSNAIEFAGNGSWSCLTLGSVSDYTEVDHNVCSFPLAGAGEWVAGHGSTPSALAAWQATGFGQSSQQAAPGFRDPATADLSVGATSVLVDNGHPALSSSWDYSGRARDPAPDVGAHEYVPVVVPVLTVTHSGTTTVRYPPMAAQTHDVIRGIVSNLTDAGGTVDLGPVRCLAMGDVSGVVPDGLPGSPGSGSALFYLLRVQGSGSSYGSSSRGRNRGPSGGDCP